MQIASWFRYRLISHSTKTVSSIAPVQGQVQVSSLGNSISGSSISPDSGVASGSRAVY